METTNNEKQANDFLAKTNTIFNAKFLKHSNHFINDKNTRDIYEITLKRGNRSYTFNYGQSINRSCLFKVKNYPKYKNMGWATKKEALMQLGYNEEKNIYKNPDFSEPKTYDVLSCITKQDPGTFENFCGEFDYDTDNKNAEKTYNAVCNEFKNVAMLFNDDELKELQEIQ